MDYRGFREFLPSSRIELLSSLSVHLGDKYQLLSYLLDRCLVGQDAYGKLGNIWEKLKERENSVSTGVGLGVAIPHCSSACVDSVLAYMAILKQGIDFQAIDDIPVRIVLLILFPKEKYEKHVKLLSVMARILNENHVREDMLQATNSSEVQKVMLSALER